MDALTEPQRSFDLELRRRIPAAPALVFKAWTDPEALKRWFGPTVEYHTVITELDLRVGGKYRFELRHSDGTTVHVAFGTYLEIEEPKRLSFTWKWESRRDTMPETIVSVDLVPDGAGTELIFTHSGFDDAPDRDEHREGWTGCLDRLAGHHEKDWNS